MHKITIAGIFFLIFLFSISTDAQHKKTINIVGKLQSQPEVYPIAGSDLLRHKDLEVAQFLKDNPGYLERKKLMKPSWTFIVGSTRSWTAINFATQENYSVPSTCRAIGTNCYVFVANDQWNSTVDQNIVNAVVNEFDNRTPANPGKGIYQTCLDTYGNPPNYDGDPKIIILILDIEDGFTGSGGYTAGYFYSRNEIFDNNAEIYFMDSDPSDLFSQGGLNFALGTAAHEFQHMINWNYHQDQPELTFINESLSKSAEIICGYGASMQELYADETNHYLFDWRRDDATIVLGDYARAQRFSLYLMEQLGTSSLKDFVQSYTTYGVSEIEGFKRVLAYHNTSLGKVVLNWEIANGLNNRNVNQAYGYLYNPLPVSAGTIVHNPNIAAGYGTVMNIAAEYFTYSNSSNLTVTFSSAGSNIIVKAIEIGEGSSRVLDVPLNSAFTEPEYPSIYNTIRFAVIDTNEFYSQDFQYQSSGTVVQQALDLNYESELSGDYTLDLGAGSMQAVIFNGASEYTLDSIRANIYGGNNSLTAAVWRYSGMSSNPLLSKISSDFTVQAPQGTVSWVSSSFHGQGIDAGTDFIVVFNLNQSTNQGGSSVIVAKKPGEVFSNNIFYDPGDGNWHWYSDGEGNTLLNRIRAYVSIVTGGIGRVAELSPVNYSLQQNYPNPFNPGTRIKYSIPQSGNVSIKVYDITGKEIIDLVNTFQNSGSYEVEWDGRNRNGVSLPSGMYFYSINTGTFTETRKMILIK